MNSLHKKSLILLLLIISTLPAISQVGEQRRNFSIGGSFGVNYGDMMFAYNSALAQQRMERSGLLGYAGGITARYITEKYFAMICGIQVEVNFSQRGWKGMSGNIDQDDPEKLYEIYHRTMNYVEIPFLAHLAFGREKGVRFFINIGPQISFLLSESEHFDEKLWDSDKYYAPQYNKDTERKFDYGIAGGLGLELRTKAGNFLLEGRYYFGLSDIFNNASKDPLSRSAHSVIMGKLTYLFDLTR